MKWERINYLFMWKLVLVYSLFLCQQFYSVKGSGYVSSMQTKHLLQSIVKKSCEQALGLAIHWYVFVNRMAHADILEQKK